MPTSSGSPSTAPRPWDSGLVNEDLTFDGDLVTVGDDTYLGGDANPAGATAGA
jgi:hypothetical protein